MLPPCGRVEYCQNTLLALLSYLEFKKRDLDVFSIHFWGVSCRHLKTCSKHCHRLTNVNFIKVDSPLFILVYNVLYVFYFRSLHPIQLCIAEKLLYKQIIVGQIVCTGFLLFIILHYMW